MNQAELNKILELHSKWLRDEKGGQKANLSFANLSSANLRSANLRSANLRFANLRSANLSFANLSSANLSSADLSFANLSFANLSSANLRSANLRFANLRSANLSFAIGEGGRIKTLIFNEYIISAVDDGRIYGGCTLKSIDEWLGYDGVNESESDRKYLENITKPFLLMVKASGHFTNSETDN